MQNVLLIDNYDSFTFNIVDYFRRFQGIRLKIKKSRELSVDHIEQFDKIIISPGPGLPREFPDLFDVFDHFIDRKPMLCICLGHQALSQHQGGSLVRLTPVVHGQAHPIKILKMDPLFNSVPVAFKVGLYHSWAVDKKTLPGSLELIALSESNVVMAIKHKDFPVYGLQFHPESFITDHGFTLFRNFVEL